MSSGVLQTDMAKMACEIFSLLLLSALILTSAYLRLFTPAVNPGKTMIFGVKLLVFFI